MSQVESYEISAAAPPATAQGVCGLAVRVTYTGLRPQIMVSAWGGLCPVGNVNCRGEC